MSVIAVDLDGTLFEYHSAYVYMARNYLDASIPDATEWDRWDWPNAYLEPWAIHWMRTEAVDLGLYRYGHIMKGGIIAVRKLAAKHDIIVITHRPKAAVPDTIDWLAYARLPLSGVHILTEGQPKSSVQYDLLIDDRPDNIEDAIGHARGGILFDQPHNQHASYKWPARATWQNMEGAIDERNHVRPS